MTSLPRLYLESQHEVLFRQISALVIRLFTGPVTMALTTLQRVKDRMDKDNSNQDDLLGRIINSVEGFIESRCNRTEHGFEETTITKEIYNGSDLGGYSQQYLILNHAPVEVDSIDLFEYRSGTKVNPNWTAFTETSYELIEPDNGIVIVDGGLPQGRRNVRITYTAGYKVDFNNVNTSNHTLPHDLTDLAERLVVKFYKRRDDDGRTTINMNTSSVEYSDYLDDIDKEVMANYNRAFASL